MPDFNFEKGEVLLVNKPIKWTSFDVVHRLRNALKQNYGRLKVGHAGTLDPLATGLLIVCTGHKTKDIDSLQMQEKEYTGTFVLGATTPTYDSEMPPDATFEIAHISEDEIRSVVTRFRGEIEQMPPLFSALKVKGKVAYQEARKGRQVELQPRTISIFDFEITAIEMPLVHFRVVCSKGTYIRSLAHDFGKALGSGAYLGALCRTRIGEYKLTDAYEVKALTELMRASFPRVKFTEQNPK